MQQRRECSSVNSSDWLDIKPSKPERQLKPQENPTDRSIDSPSQVTVLTIFRSAGIMEGGRWGSMTEWNRRKANDKETANLSKAE